MNKRANQKTVEKEVFEQFLRLQKGSIPEDITPVYGDEPDLIMELPDNKKVGVELRELNISEAFRELESIKTDILRRTKEKCIEKGVENISALMTFSIFAGLPNPAYRVAKWSTKRKGEIAEELATQIEEEVKNLRDISDGGESIRFRPAKTPEVSEVAISKSSVKTTADHPWHINNAGFVTTHIIPLIKEAFNEKDKNYDRYLKKCDECWLLFHADRGHKAKRLFFREEDRAHKFVSNFSRAFFMECFHDDLHELNLNRETTAQFPS